MFIQQKNWTKKYLITFKKINFLFPVSTFHQNVLSKFKISYQKRRDQDVILQSLEVKFQRVYKKYISVAESVHVICIEIDIFGHWTVIKDH